MLLVENVLVENFLKRITVLIFFTVTTPSDRGLDTLISDIIKRYNMLPVALELLTTYELAVNFTGATKAIFEDFMRSSQLSAAMIQLFKSASLKKLATMASANVTSFHHLSPRSLILYISQFESSARTVMFLQSITLMFLETTIEQIASILNITEYTLKNLPFLTGFYPRLMEIIYPLQSKQLMNIFVTQMKYDDESFESLYGVSMHHYVSLNARLKFASLMQNQVEKDRVNRMIQTISMYVASRKLHYESLFDLPLYQLAVNCSWDVSTLGSYRLPQVMTNCEEFFNMSYKYAANYFRLDDFFYRSLTFEELGSYLDYSISVWPQSSIISMNVELGVVSRVFNQPFILVALNSKSRALHELLPRPLLNVTSEILVKPPKLISKLFNDSASVLARLEFHRLSIFFEQHQLSLPSAAFNILPPKQLLTAVVNPMISHTLRDYHSNMVLYMSKNVTLELVRKAFDVSSMYFDSLSLPRVANDYFGADKALFMKLFSLTSKDYEAMNNVLLVDAKLLPGLQGSIYDMTGYNLGGYILNLPNPMNLLVKTLKQVLLESIYQSSGVNILKKLSISGALSRLGGLKSPSELFRLMNVSHDIEQRINTLTIDKLAELLNLDFKKFVDVSVLGVLGRIAAVQGSLF